MLLCLAPEHDFPLMSEVDRQHLDEQSDYKRSTRLLMIARAFQNCILKQRYAHCMSGKGCLLANPRNSEKVVYMVEKNELEDE